MAVLSTRRLSFNPRHSAVHALLAVVLPDYEPKGRPVRHSHAAPDASALRLVGLWAVWAGASAVALGLALIMVAQVGSAVRTGSGPPFSAAALYWLYMVTYLVPSGALATALAAPPMLAWALVARRHPSADARTPLLVLATGVIAGLQAALLAAVLWSGRFESVSSIAVWLLLWVSLLIPRLFVSRLRPGVFAA